MKIKRTLMLQLERFLLPGKVLVLYGPRQVGKTTLVQDFLNQVELRSRFVNAETFNNREALSSQSVQKLKALLGDAELLVIDEAQKVPNIGINLKLLVDTFPDVKVIATGSASFDLANKLSEPLTGRKFTFTLYPVSYRELCESMPPIDVRGELERWIIWGGYPAITTTDDLVLRETMMNELVSSYLYRDILEMEGIRHSDKIIDLLRLLAYQIGQEVSIAELGTNLSMNRRTVMRYLELLEKSFVIYRVGGFSRNLRKEIIKNARYFFYDNGVRNSLIQNFNPLRYRDDVGMLWENYLMTERRKTNQAQHRSVNAYFWRTYDQKEVDLIEEYGGVLHGYEFKWRNGAIKEATRREFTETYPNSELHVINQENFESFIL
ncbi:MAG: ATP-binding protein [Anaerolineae bacterium]|nr:ATP-binding protein [Anaerolineae bacterium]